MRGPPPRRTSTRVDEPRTFWLVTLIQTAMLAVVAYFIAVFVFVILERITQLPTGAVWDEGGFRAPLLFVLVALTAGLISVPYFQKEWDQGSRTLSLFSATFLLAYAIFHATGAIDPDLPMNAFIWYVVDPVRRTFGW